ncbi:hypothetical protein [Knoellia sp. Soil729]|uniref:hypothetical protein n=1 Tax=Knoellia sp. Soil729 TaxID=1736394 RepID=UPI0006FA6D72|nr:hypothetical protein [Knoellia sp. Soil729]KRE42872.1 hypothetical protein ASG74_10960 [Knoellia sp. Soil729]
MTYTPDALHRLSDEFDGVATLSELASAGVSRATRRSLIRSGRWRPIGAKGVVLHTGPLIGRQAWRAALIRVGAGAALGGVTALQAGGLQGFDEPRTHIWVPKSCAKDPRELPDDVVLHETRRWSAKDCVDAGMPRSSPPVATIQAALWAVSARQSALCLVMPVQQRLVRPADLVAELDRVQRHAFRSMLRAVAGDLLGGAQSLNELDFAIECRRRGLPEPTRQLPRRLSSGRVVLDVFWDRYGVCVEVNGAGHDQVLVSLRDEVRLTDLQAQGDAAIPLSVLTLRVDPDPFFTALAGLLRSRGWPG